MATKIQQGDFKSVGIVLCGVYTNQHTVVASASVLKISSQQHLSQSNPIKPLADNILKMFNDAYLIYIYTNLANIIHSGLNLPFFSTIFTLEQEKNLFIKFS